jgi:hypothetical protein
MTNTAFSVFASSHYVPTALMSVDNNTLSTNEATVDNITSTFGIYTNEGLLFFL